MIELKDKKLKEILKRINTDTKTREIYASKLNRVLNFLRNNTGFKMAGVKEGGSLAKQTDTRKSDLDIIFCTSKDQNHKIFRNDLLNKGKAAFKNGAKVYLGKKAVHIDFFKPRCNVDLVYLSNKEFQQESKKIKKIRKLRPLHKNSIKLAKYAFDKAGINDVKGHEVELACLNFDYNTLSKCVYHLIKYFSGRIKKRGLNLDRVLKFLT